MLTVNGGKAMSDFIFTILSTAVNEETHEIACQTKCIGELVRCKDCKHYILGECEIFSPVLMGFTLDNDDYCSYAERRKEND